MRAEALLTFAAALHAATAATMSTIANTSFGIDPLVITDSSGNQQLSSILFDPSNAHSGTGYLSISFPAAKSDNQYTTFRYPFHLSAHTNYTARVFAKPSNASVECLLGTYFHGNNGQQLNNATSGYVKGAMGIEYREYVVQAESGPQAARKEEGAAFLELYCYAGVATTVYLDDFVVTSP